MNLKEEKYYIDTVTRIASAADTFKQATNEKEMLKIKAFNNYFQDERDMDESDELTVGQNMLLHSHPSRPIMNICTLRQALEVDYSAAFGEEHNPLILIKKNEMDKCVDDDDLLDKMLVIYIDFLNENPYCRGDLFTYLLYDFSNIGIYITDPQTDIESLVIVV